MKLARAFYDSIATAYDARFQNQVALIENDLICHDLPTRNVLDLGCGTGLYLEYCQPDGYVGLDVSKEMICVAQSKFPDHRFIQADMASLPFPDESFDSVVSLFGSFSYCLTPHRCVDEIHRVLRPGGRVVVMVLGQRYIHRRSHVAPQLPFLTYTARQLRHLFRAFETVKIRGLNWQMDALWWLPCIEGYARLEHRIVGRLFPSWCYFLIVEVSKDAQASIGDECVRCRDRPIGEAVS